MQQPIRLFWSSENNISTSRVSRKQSRHLTDAKSIKTATTSSL